MLRKVLGAVLIILGLAAAGLGVASATLWREPDSVVAVAVPQGDGTLVMTAPGVLELVGPDVTVVATVPGDETVTVAVGRTLDVEGWIGIDHSTRVDGLADWETLATSAVVPEIPEPAEGKDPPEPGTGANPARNDMWLAEASGEGSATLRWSDRPGRWSLLVAGVGEDAEAPTVELTWPREPSTPWLWPGAGTGAALLVAGLLVLLVRRKGKSAAAGPVGDGPADDGGPGTGTTSLGVVSSPAAAAPVDGIADAAAQAPTDQDETPAAPPPSRRSRRRAAQAAVAAAKTSPAPATGSTESTESTEPAKAAPGATAAQDAAEPGEGADAQASAEPPAPTRRWPFSSSANAPGQTSTRRGLARREPTPTPVAGEARVPQVPGEQAAAPAPFPRPDATAQDATHAHDPGQGTPEAGEPAGGDSAHAATVTGSMPRVTRRELREQEEARRAAAQTGLTGRIRALTGSIPVVRPAPAKPPAAGTDAPATRASRSQAWRQAWGFDADAGGENSTGNDSEGGTR